jgi:hypothetical protein
LKKKNEFEHVSANTDYYKIDAVAECLTMVKTAKEKIKNFKSLEKSRPKAAKQAEKPAG